MGDQNIQEGTKQFSIKSQPDKGLIRGEVLVSQHPFGFFLGVDPETGIVIDKKSDIYGQNIKDKILIYPFGRGSTGTPGIVAQALWFKTAPAAILNITAEPMIHVCSVIADEFFDCELPILEGLDKEDFSLIKSGSMVEIDRGKGLLKIL